MQGTLLFGSEIKSFVEHPHFKKELNERALESYLSFQYSPGNETFFKGVYKLPPAHYFFYKDGKMKTARYWSPEFSAEEDKSLDYWVDAIEKTFDDSIEAHKIADVEVGSFLSSGVDSSYVACSADVDKTFTVGFDNGSKYNEISYAKELSEMIPVKNYSKTITPEEFWGNFPKIQYHMDEPLADPAAVALYFVCNTASQYLKVVMSGEGADEIFGGYNIWPKPLAVPAYDRIPFPIRRARSANRLAPAEEIGHQFPDPPRQAPRGALHRQRLHVLRRERKKILKIKTDAPSPAAVVKPFYDRVKDKDPVTKMQFVDLNAWMVGDILLKADKMSMANSLELRVPFLDKEVMALAQRIPPGYRVNSENTKYAMRKAALRRMKKGPARRSSASRCRRASGSRRTSTTTSSGEVHRRGRGEILPHRTACEALDDHKNGKDDNRRVWTVYVPRLVRPVLQ